MNKVDNYFPPGQYHLYVLHVLWLIYASSAIESYHQVLDDHQRQQQQLIVWGTYGLSLANNFNRDIPSLTLDHLFVILLCIIGAILPHYRVTSFKYMSLWGIYVYILGKSLGNSNIPPWFPYPPIPCCLTLLVLLFRVYFRSLCSIFHPLKVPLYY